jgi:hypothetical protein
MAWLTLTPQIIKEFNYFYKPLDSIEDCWPWLGRTNELGYGFIRPVINKIRKVYFAHRISYMIHNQLTLLRYNIRHNCDIPSCVNPYHLLSGTQADNMHDMDTRNRRAYGEELNNSPLTRELVICIHNDRLLGMTYEELGIKYNISLTTAWNIINRKTWKHI